MNTPKISVIVPIYRVEPYLRKCLDSILGQTYPDLEIILIDDGSPDRCGEICNGYARRDKRIYVIHQENSGVASARNTGLSLSTGEWIGWVDPDDWIEPDMFGYMLEKAYAYDADIAVCSRREIYPDKTVPKGWDKELVMDRKSALQLLLKNELLQNYLCDKLWKRELFQGVEFPPGRTYEDMSVTHILFERAERVVLLPQIKYNYLQRHGSIVSDFSLENRLNHYAAARKRYDEMKDTWPEFEELLLAQCISSAVGIWSGYNKNIIKSKQKFLPELQEISDFCGSHINTIVESDTMGLAGKLVSRLIPHPKWWAFSLAQFISYLYKKRHGLPL